MSLLRATLLLALAIAAPSAVRAADEDEPAALRAELSRGERLAVSFDVTDSFTEGFRRRLLGGLLSRAIFEAALIDTDNQLVATGTRECQLRLDVWDDVLDARIRDPTRRQRRRFLVVDEGLSACGRVEDLPLGERVALNSRGPYFLRVIVRLNPVSDELVQETREFMANPRGAPVNRPSSFFDAVASFFAPNREKTTGESFVFEASGLIVPERSPSDSRAQP